MSDGTIDLDRRSVDRQGESVRLTSREAALLRHLAQRAEEVVSHAELLTEVFGYAPESTSRTVYTTVQRLRAKIEPDRTRPVHIQSVSGEGYRFRIAVPSLLEAGQKAASAIHHHGTQSVWAVKWFQAHRSELVQYVERDEPAELRARAALALDVWVRLTGDLKSLQTTLYAIPGAELSEATAYRLTLAKARHAMLAGHMERARQLMKQEAVRSRAPTFEALLFEAILCFEAGDLDGAEALAVRCKDAPQLMVQAARLDLLAVVAGRRGAWERAVTLFRKELALRTQGAAMALPVTWNNLGIALEHVGRLEEAERAYEEGVAASDGTGFSVALLWLNRAMLDLARGREARALAHAERAEQVARDSGAQRLVGVAMANRARALALLMRPCIEVYVEAIHHLAQSDGAEAHEGWAQRELSEVLEAAGRRTEAEAARVRARRLLPAFVPEDHPDARIWRRIAVRHGHSTTGTCRIPLGSSARAADDT